MSPDEKLRFMVEFKTDGYYHASLVVTCKFRRIMYWKIVIACIALLRDVCAKVVGSSIVAIKTPIPLVIAHVRRAPSDHGRSGIKIGEVDAAVIPGKGGKSCTPRKINGACMTVHPV